MNDFHGNAKDWKSQKILWKKKRTVSTKRKKQIFGRCEGLNSELYDLKIHVEALTTNLDVCRDLVFKETVRAK